MCWGGQSALSPESLAAPGAPRVLLAVAHPDDEWLGAGSLLPAIRDLWIVQVTDGAPRDMKDARALGFRTREQYARARRLEARASLRSAGIPADRRIELGFVDQEAHLALDAVIHDLHGIFVRAGPDLVLTHPYEGGHPDHDAVAFAVAAAAGKIEGAGGRAPARIEMAAYHAGPRGELLAGVFLESNLAARSRPRERVRVLTEAERERKARALRCFASQRRTIGLFPSGEERYRAAPEYDFRCAPQPRPLLYERLGLGPGWSFFRERVEAALEGPEGEGVAWTREG